MNKYDKDIACIEQAQNYIGQAQRALEGVKHADVEELQSTLSMAESEADMAEGHAIDASNLEDDRILAEKFGDDE